jgi:hypothetical protein
MQIAPGQSDICEFESYMPSQQIAFPGSYLRERFIF